MIEVLAVFARAGGGGSGGGGGGAGIIVLPLVIFGIIASWWIRRKRILKAKAHQHTALAKDHTWSDAVIEARVSEVFHAFQKDWGQFNTENMKNYLTTRYHDHITIMLAALKQMGRRNLVTDVNLSSVTLFGVHDHVDDELDRFNVEIKASVKDVLIDEATRAVIKSDTTSFEEVWHFEREGRQWMLDVITQVNRDDLVVEYEPVIDDKYLGFAESNKFFYNADFGWLLMPFRGILFSESDYGRSDINHHVIGLYHNIIVQFFEYIPLTEEKANLGDHFKHWYRARNPLAKYTIAHATLPKDYGNIIVERKKVPSFFNFTPNNMTKVMLEWLMFNKLFNVFATDLDKVNSLELLHPAFMERLAGVSFKVNLEIVGNDLYLYTTDKKANYQQMLDLLKEAFKEMKM